MELAIRYTIFALLSTAANIAAQDGAIRLYDGAYGLLSSMVVGTAVGLVVKYLLDKRYIFGVRAKSLVHDGRMFALYSLMGVATTAIFWGFEFTFHFVFDDKAMRYLGGVIGLAIGYWVKYRLDKRYVFQEAA